MRSTSNIVTQDTFPKMYDSWYHAITTIAYKLPKFSFQLSFLSYREKSLLPDCNYISYSTDGVPLNFGTENKRCNEAFVPRARAIQSTVQWIYLTTDSSRLQRKWWLLLSENQALVAFLSYWNIAHSLLARSLPISSNPQDHAFN